MIEITIDQFEQLLPMVGAASEDVFLRMEPAFESEYQDLVDSVVGEGFEEAATTEGTLLAQRIRNYVILSTFLLSLRSHDLIMTDTGFGVVSNDNIAPASQQRVDALERELTYKRDTSLHHIIRTLRSFDGWAATEQAHTTIRSLVWSPVILRSHCGVRGRLTFDDLARHKAEIDHAENFLRLQLSDELMDQMLDEERRCLYTESHRMARRKMLDFIGSCLSIDGTATDRERSSMCFDSVLRYIEDHLADFPLYQSSNAYRANHMEAYDNKTDDPTFFFGC